MSSVDLMKEVGYVKFTYPDSTVRLIRTTMNDELLRDVLKNRPENSLFDLDKRRWVKLPDPKEVVMSITREKPKMEGYHEFVNRFL